MKPIRNPFLGGDGYNCFGCAPHNPLGLAMSFYQTEDEVISLWEPRPEYQGFDDVLHGGIQATLMDEIASWYIFVKLRTSGMTEGMTVGYHRPVYTNEGGVTLTARLEEERKRRADIRVRLFQGDEESPRSEALCTYAIFPEPLARKKLHYPGYEAFLPEGER